MLVTASFSLHGVVVAIVERDEVLCILSQDDHTQRSLPLSLPYMHHVTDIIVTTMLLSLVTGFQSVHASFEAILIHWGAAFLGLTNTGAQIATRLSGRTRRVVCQQTTAA